LLVQIGYSPDRILPATVDESPRKAELPQALAVRLALAKATDVAIGEPDAFVLGADTVVARGRRILPKPHDAEAARNCLRQLSGGRHRVLGGIAVVVPGGRVVSRLITTVVAFKRLSEEEIRWYVESGEWRDKAGGYAIQGRAAAFVRQIIGSYSNVVGLGLYETAALLAGLGLPPRPSGR
jgi:septum formation protein